MNIFSSAYSYYGDTLYRMDNQHTELDFLKDLTPLSTALVKIPFQLPNADIGLSSGSLIIINSDICFKKI